MSNNPKKSGPFDVKTVEALVALMSANDLSEIYLKDGGQHVRLRRGTTALAVAPAAPTGSQFLNMMCCWPSVHRLVVTQ